MPLPERSASDERVVLAFRGGLCDVDQPARLLRARTVVLDSMATPHPADVPVSEFLGHGVGSLLSVCVDGCVAHLSAAASVCSVAMARNISRCPSS